MQYHRKCAALSQLGAYCYLSADDVDDPFDAWEV